MFWLSCPRIPDNSLPEPLERWDPERVINIFSSLIVDLNLLLSRLNLKLYN